MSKEGSATILIKLSSLSYLKLHKLEKIIRNHGQKWRGYFPKNNQIHTLSSWKQNIVSLTGQTYLNSVCKCVWPFSKHQAFTNVLNLYGLKTLDWLLHDGKFIMMALVSLLPHYELKRSVHYIISLYKSWGSTFLRKS